MFLFLCFHIISWYVIINYYFKNTLKNIRNNYGYTDLSNTYNEYDIKILYSLVLLNYALSLLIIITYPLSYLLNNMYLYELKTINYINFKVFIIIEIVNFINYKKVPNIFKFIFYNIIDYYFMHLINYDFLNFQVFIYNLINFIILVG